VAINSFGSDQDDLPLASDHHEEIGTTDPAISCGAHRLKAGCHI
jgi:hypothetical protein